MFFSAVIMDVQDICSDCVKEQYDGLLSIS